MAENGPTNHKWEPVQGTVAAKVIEDDLESLLRQHPIGPDTIMAWILFVLIVDGKLNEVKAVLRNAGDAQFGITKPPPDIPRVGGDR